MRFTGSHQKYTTFLSFHIFSIYAIELGSHYWLWRWNSFPVHNMTKASGNYSEKREIHNFGLCSNFRVISFSRGFWTELCFIALQRLSDNNPWMYNGLYLRLLQALRRNTGQGVRFIYQQLLGFLCFGILSDTVFSELFSIPHDEFIRKKQTSNFIIWN